MNRTPPPMDKIDTHYRQQLSALVDGELAADQARFLLRRLQHDPDLQACQERWQLLGDVMRGRAVAPAPAGFAERVAAAVAAEPAAARVPRHQDAGWRRWGGGAALAASVAMVALLMGRPSVQPSVPAEAVSGALARQPTAAAPAAAHAAAEHGTARAPAPTTPTLQARVPATALAAARRRQDDGGRRASATRSQQAVRAARGEIPARALAAGLPLTPSLPPAVHPALPFGDVGTLQARPWPRSRVGTTVEGALNANYPATAPGAFYPFEPRLQDDLPALERRD